MKDNRFSIVTPVYNRQDCIERCIMSVQNNTYKNFEHIIIDDGSSDDTYSISKALKEKYSNIELIKNGENRGVNYSRNKGIASSKGEYILILDSDDQLKQNALQNISDTINNFPEYNHYLFLPDDMADLYKNVKKLQEEHSVIEFKDWLSGEIWGDFVHVIKRECFDDIKFDENYRIYEGITFLRLYKKNQYQFFTNKIISIRERNRKDSVSHEYELKNIKSIDNQFKILKKEIEEFEQDFQKLGLSGRFQYLIKRAIILGLAANEYEETGLLINLTKNNYFIFKVLYKFRAGFILRNMIYIKSHLNSLKLKLK